ncbi:MAG: DUF4038 domain-containing protein, partial [Leptolyngbya sp. SIO3F4]|nr:DUF4038 domain-containing protein [Leptolyngbya sp. SIO3F4]
PQHLITFHPQGGASSSDYFHNDEWLDFNLFQSGHGAPDFPNYEMAIADYEKTPIKPVLDGEPRYENIPIGFKIKNGRHLDFSVRKAAYFSLLSGSCGHTYGNNNIWQMWVPGRGAAIKARTPWYNAIHHPGATQMGYARKLLESRSFHLLQRAQNILAYPKNYQNIRVALNPTKTALIYIPEGQAVKINTEGLSMEKIRAWWFDPREGTAEKIKDYEISENEILDFIPPSQGIFNDWVLVLDNAAAGYEAPGN